MSRVSRVISQKARKQNSVVCVSVLCVHVCRAIDLMRPDLRLSQGLTPPRVLILLVLATQYRPSRGCCLSVDGIYPPLLSSPSPHHMSNRKKMSSTCVADNNDGENGAGGGQVPDADASASPYTPLMFTPSDEEFLSPQLCLVRSLLQYFPASPEDIKVRQRKGGASKALRPNRVGIRCVHCAPIPPSERPNGAVSYPKNVGLVHQAVRNWQRFHLWSCPNIPQSTKDRLKSMGRGRKQAGCGGSAHWVASCAALGMRDCPDGEGIEFVAGVGDADADADAGAMGASAVGGAESGYAYASAAAASVTSASSAATAQQYASAAVPLVSASVSTSSMDQTSLAPMAAAALSAPGVDAASMMLSMPMPPLPEAPHAQQQLLQQQMMMLPSDVLSNVLNSTLEPIPLHHGAAGAGAVPGAAGGTTGGQEQLGGALSGSSTMPSIGGTPATPSLHATTAAAADALSFEDHTEAFSNLKDDLAELDFGDDDDDEVYIDLAIGQEEATIPIGGKPASVQGVGGNDVLTEDLTHSCDESQTSELTLSSEHAQLLTMVRSALDLVVTFQAELQGKGGEGNVGSNPELHRSLGRILYEHFSGKSYLEDDEAIHASDRDGSTCREGGNVDSGSSDGDTLDDGSEQASKKKGRRTTIGSTAKSIQADCSGYVPLLDLGYPIRLSTMVDCLVKSGSSANDNNCSFASVKDVEEEIHAMLEQPSQNLYDVAAAVYCDGHLRFAENKLYGRSDELATLMSAYDRVIHSKKEKRGIALINGYAGTGKSSLVDQILPCLQSDRAGFVHCKFDIQGQEQPMSSFFRALDGYCRTLVDGDPTLLAEIRGAINYALGPSVSLLKGQVPHLGAVLGRDSPVLQAAETTNALNHISYSLRLFVRAISGPSHPLVFLLDDLQYADKNSVDVINLLLKDAEATSLLFIGCYREESVSIDHPLTEGLGEIAMTAEVPMSSISLGNLNKESVNDMVCDALNMSRRLTRPLADALHAKTNGNPMFVRQLMASLNVDGLIRYSAITRRWEWNIKAIREKNVADNAVDLLVGRMKGYGPEIELLLQVASCIGTSFDAKALFLCFADDKCNEGSVDSCLMKLVVDGLITKVGTVYRFGHDLIWQAAYALTPSSKQASMHLHVGRQLLQNGKEEEQDQMLSTIADQLNRGIDLITDDAERVLLVKLNLQVAQKELSTMSFLPASLYLLQGTILVRDEDWKDHYDMCLQLFTSCADVQLALGNSSETISLATQVLSRGKSLQDKFGAYHALMKAKISQGDAEEPVKIGLSILEQLGESFPSNVDQDEIGKELMSTKYLLETSSMEEVLDTDAMTDADRVATMRFLLLVSNLCCCCCALKYIFSR